MRLAELANARVAIWGFGREGRAALAVLRRRFPQKVLTLICSEKEAAQARHEQTTAQDAPIEIITVPPDVTALTRFDVIIKSPGISPYKSPVPEAAAAGARFTSVSALWFAEHPHARTICVTGTKGKSTVTALIAHLLRNGGHSVALAGNIGMPLLELLEPPHEPDWWVIELSSFQTRDFGGAPTVAVVNNVYEEHLDWHGSQTRYQADKLKILDDENCIAVLNATDLAAGSIRVARKTVWFNLPGGWHVRADAVWRGDECLLHLSDLPLPGEHNAQNVCAALAALEAAGEDARTLAQYVKTFHALPHRLQSLGTQDGLEYVNDSISTTPYATIEALRSLEQRQVTVIVGGFDRGVDWSSFVQHVAQHPPQAIVATGANGARIAEALRTIASPRFTLVCAPTLDEVLATARVLTPQGGVVLLSPGAPSFDQYRDYTERGREFARLAGFDAGTIAQIPGLGIL